MKCLPVVREDILRELKELDQQFKLQLEHQKQLEQEELVNQCNKATKLYHTPRRHFK